MNIIFFLPCNWVQCNASTSQTKHCHSVEHQDWPGNLEAKVQPVPCLHSWGHFQQREGHGAERLWELASRCSGHGPARQLLHPLTFPVASKPMPITTHCELSYWSFNNSGKFKTGPFTKEWGLLKTTEGTILVGLVQCAIPRTHNSLP